MIEVKILISDDEPGSLFVLQTMLEEMNHSVISTHNGEEAWNYYQQQLPLLVITDWQMPKLDGIGLIKRIREQETHLCTYIIVLTALEGLDNFSEAAQAGADDYVCKPFEEDVLYARLHLAQRFIQLRQELFALKGLLPTCIHCKNIRTEEGRWTPFPSFLETRANLKLPEEMCPCCSQLQQKSNT